MSTRALLTTIRDGMAPDPGALSAFARGLADGSVSDAQAGAFAMAVCCGPGLGEAGRVALTKAMAESGHRLTWDLPGPVVDKHSTGGVGDPVSLLLAPMLACVGAHVPMISGRGLGHTGGTLDKLEAIPGFTVDLAEDRFRHIVQESGAAIVAASRDIAPADRRLYALRDVTGTVDQIDLITASILSKKLAAGLEALVLDVKCGLGAFMQSHDEARMLAEALSTTATGAGCPTTALITEMDQPLASACGNALEIACVMRALSGEGEARLLDVTYALGGALLERAGMAGSAEEGAAKLQETLGSGRAMEAFARMVAAQGGPSNFAETWQTHLASAPVIRDVTATERGTLSRVDGTALGLAVVGLGGGRQREGDAIDPAVGLSDVARLGASLAPGDLLARIHAASEEAADVAEEELRAALTIGGTPDPKPLVMERIG